MRTATCLFAGLALAGLLAACSESSTIVTPSPASPAPQFPPVPQPSPQTGPTLTGVVSQNTGQGRRPISGARVFVVDLVEGPYGNYGWYQLVSDPNGRFSFGGLPPGRAVKLTAFDGPGYGIWNQSGLSQVCAVHPTIHGDTTADIELVQAGVLPMTYGSPTLSGVVFETTAEGRRPASDMAVVYSSNSHDGADVYARTDGEGRYTFCGIPLGAGYLLPACTRAVVPIPGYRPTTFPVEIRGDTVLDAGCP